MVAEPTDFEAYKASLAQRQKMLGDTGTKLGGGPGGPHDPGMEQRVTTLERDFTALKDGITRIEGALSGLPTRADLSSIPGKGTIWAASISIVLAVIGTVIGVGSILVSTSANQLSAFQSGLSAVQTVIAARQPLPPLVPPADK